MRRIVKHFAATFSMLVAGCAAGGGGCGGCDGVTPLPEGFKPEARVENAGSARLTASGVAFLEQNLGTLAQSILGDTVNGGVITFDVPQSTGSAVGIDYTVCPGGADPSQTPPKCSAEIDLANAQLQVDPQAPRNIRIHGPLPVRLQNLPIEIDYGIFGTDDMVAVLNGNGGCPPGNQTFANIDLDVDISIEIDADATHSRYGYTKVRIASVSVNENQIEDALKLNCEGSFSGTILDFMKGLVVPSLIDGLIGTLSDQLNEQLCQQANPELSPSCPVGTGDDGNGTCVYPDGSCASIILGLDGNVNLGQLLASISPGTTGGLDFLFAAGGQSARDDGSGLAWGDLNPIGGGATLGLYGGAEPVPVSKCVKLSEMVLPTGIPIPDELLGDALDGWPDGMDGPHVGIALSERFTNYAMSGVYNSGLLCLGITTEAVPLLNLATLGIFASSAKDLGIQQENQAIAIVVRPSAPPRVTFGNGTNIETDPLVRVQLDQASFDFYAWSLDRYIRFMTATYDLDVPVNLTVTPEGLVPVLEKIGMNNGKVTNNGLLREDPQGIADSLSELISGQVGQALGGIDPIDLNGSLASLGLALNIPETVDGQGSPGLRRLEKGQDGYLGIFASFGIASQMSQLVAETQATVRSKEVLPEGLTLPTMTPDNGPRVTLVMGSDLDDGTRAMEYQIRIDEGAWRPFTRERIIDVEDAWLRLQGRHVISVRSRVVGEPYSLDPTPAQVEVIVDAEPPQVVVGPVEDGRARLEVKDQVSGDASELRYRLDDGDWSAWTKASELGVIEVGEAEDIEVEARDEEGNLGTAQQALIRGRMPTGDSDAGCGCEVAGGPQTGGPAGWLVAAALAGLGARLKRRRDQAKRAVARGAAGGLLVVAAAGSQSGCSCGDVETPNVAGCADCLSLAPGLIGAYTSAAVSGDKVWVAGYNEADHNLGYKYGDLAVGTVDGDRVAWTLVDGVPSEPAPDPKKVDTRGFRGGQTEAGDDVGLWTSIAIGPDGAPAVAYYDRTHRRLKFAQVQGADWKVSVVQEKPRSDIGRYAKLLFLNGTPVIAYLASEPGEGGAVTSAVRLAWGGSATPGEGQWTFEDVATDPATPCRAFHCDVGTACIPTTGRCEAEADGCGECATGEQCVDDGTGQVSCQAKIDANRLETYPDAIGDYVAIAPEGTGGLAVAFYDRIRGNAVIASKSSGAWQTLVVDGQAADGTDTGDVGIGMTLHVDSAGDWHLAYADGLSEGLRYVKVAGGTQAGAPEVVDDGTGIEGTPFDDGQHIVGDDANLVVTGGGEVRVSYQDATSGTLRYAVGTPSGQGHTWQVREIPQEGFAGAFSRIVEVGGQIRIANWWRVGGEAVLGDVAFVTP